MVLQGNIVGEVPDIAFHTLGSMRIFNSRQLATPLDAYIDGDSEFSAIGYLPAMRKMGQLDGITLSLPFEVSAPTIFYNTDLVEQAGEDPNSLPTSWDDIVALVRKIDDLGDDVTGGHFEYDQSNAWMLQALVMSQAGNMLNSEGTAIGFDNDIGLNAFDILRSLGEKGMVDMSRDQARQVFSAGKLGVLVTSNSILNALRKQAVGTFEIGVGSFPIPALAGGLPAGGNAAVVHAKDVERVQAAWDYIKFAIGPIGQAISIANTGYLPVNDTALGQSDIVGDLAANESYLKAVSISPRLLAPTDFPGENAVRIAKLMMDRMQTVITLKQDPETALRELTSEVNGLLA
jgi:multiple sugar transport system substrate-binding protein